MKVALITTMVAVVTVAVTQAYYIKPDRTKQANGLYDDMAELMKHYRERVVLNRARLLSGHNVPMDNVNSLEQLLTNRLRQQEVDGNRNEAYNGGAVSAVEVPSDVNKRGGVCQEIIFAPWRNSLCKRKVFDR